MSLIQGRTAAILSLWKHSFRTPFKHLFTHDILIHLKTLNNSGKLLVCMLLNFKIGIDVRFHCNVVNNVQLYRKRHVTWGGTFLCARKVLVQREDIITPFLSCSAFQQHFLERGSFPLSCLSWKVYHYILSDIKKTWNTNCNSISGISWTWKLPKQTHETAQFECPYLCLWFLQPRNGEDYPSKCHFCMYLMKCSQLKCSRWLKFYFIKFLLVLLRNSLMLTPPVLLSDQKIMESLGLILSHCAVIVPFL